MDAERPCGDIDPTILWTTFAKKSKDVVVIPVTEASILATPIVATIIQTSPSYLRGESSICLSEERVTVGSVRSTTVPEEEEGEEDAPLIRHRKVMVSRMVGLATIRMVVDECLTEVAEWGEMSMCDAERRLLANALLDLSNEWFVLLSESCMPLYNFSVVYIYLNRSNYSFVNSFDDPSPHARGRYNPQMAPLINVSQWRKGSQWFEVDRKVAIHMVQDTKYYLSFKTFCRPPCYVDEHYFPTLLHIEASSLIANRTITFTDWSRGGSHPATFGGDDISEQFFNKILEGQDCLYNGEHSSICVLFARKFAPSALQPLLQLASTVLGFR